MRGFSASGREESRKEVLGNSVIKYQERAGEQSVNHYAHTTSMLDTPPSAWRGEGGASSIAKDNTQKSDGRTHNEYAPRTPLTSEGKGEGGARSIATTHEYARRAPSHRGGGEGRGRVEHRPRARASPTASAHPAAVGRPDRMYSARGGYHPNSSPQPDRHAHPGRDAAHRSVQPARSSHQRPAPRRACVVARVHRSSACRSASVRPPVCSCASWLA